MQITKNALIAVLIAIGLVGTATVAYAAFTLSVSAPVGVTATTTTTTVSTSTVTTSIPSPVTSAQITAISFGSAVCSIQEFSDGQAAFCNSPPEGGLTLGITSTITVTPIVYFDSANDSVLTNCGSVTCPPTITTGPTTTYGSATLSVTIQNTGPDAINPTPVVSYNQPGTITITQTSTNAPITHDGSETFTWLVTAVSPTTGWGTISISIPG